MGFTVCLKSQAPCFVQQYCCASYLWLLWPPLMSTRMSLLRKPLMRPSSWGMGVLDSVMFDNFHEDAAKVCYWNDWAARDGRARIERTFNHGRMSKQKKTLGIPNGRWYCCYKQEALETLGHELDH